MARRRYGGSVRYDRLRTVPAGEVIEVDGLLWKPKSGATSSGEQFSRARSLLLEIHRDASWNPWVEGDRTQEYQQATAVFEQWTRAEPGFRQLTSEEVDAGMATWDAEFEARNAEHDRQQAARVALYDEGREQARLALLEQQAILRHCSQKLDDLRERRRFPAMPEQPRRAQIAELQQSVAAARTAVVRLQEQVGDVETVVDQHGWLPQERRELALSLFSARRCSEVRELRERVREQPTTLQATKGRAFCLTNANLTGEQQRDRFLANINRMNQRSRRPGPWICAVYERQLVQIWPRRGSQKPQR